MKSISFPRIIVRRYLINQRVVGWRKAIGNDYIGPFIIVFGCNRTSPQTNKKIVGRLQSCTIIIEIDVFEYIWHAKFEMNWKWIHNIFYLLLIHVNILDSTKDYAFVSNKMSCFTKRMEIIWIVADYSFSLYIEWLNSKHSIRKTCKNLFIFPKIDRRFWECFLFCANFFSLRRYFFISRKFNLQCGSSQV